jgi:undecaprenyl-diphosphatase
MSIVKNQATTKVFTSLWLVLSLGLITVVGALFLFYELTEKVIKGDAWGFDESGMALVNGFASPWMTSFMRTVTYLGSNVFLLIAGACVVVIFVLARWRRATVTLLVTMAGAALLNFTLKQLFRRQRPEPFLGITHPESFSFPSGHALLSFCFYGVLAAMIAARFKGRVQRVAVWAGAALLIALIGLSRVYLRFHYPSDVVAGYVAAFVWLVIVLSADRIMRARVRRKD